MVAGAPLGWSFPLCIGLWYNHAVFFYDHTDRKEIRPMRKQTIACASVACAFSALAKTADVQDIRETVVDGSGDACGLWTLPMAY